MSLVAEVPPHSSQELGAFADILSHQAKSLAGQALARRDVEDLVVLDIALLLEDLNDLDPQAEGGHVDFPLLRLHAVADPGEQVR